PTRRSRSFRLALSPLHGNLIAVASTPPTPPRSAMPHSRLVRSLASVTRSLALAALVSMAFAAPVWAEVPPAFLYKWGTQGGAPGQFDHPSMLATDAQGYVYVGDQGNHRVQKFTPGGAFVTAWGSAGNGPGQLSYPSGVTVGPFGDVYVVEQQN